MKRLIRYFDMFAGIGGFRAGMTRAGGFQCVGHCEIDKHADASYHAIHKPEKEECFYSDARTIDPGSMPDFDLLCGGFPCQSFSCAGRRRGFEDARGTLFFEIARVAKARRPAYIWLENVPALLSHDKGRTFSTILSALHGLGYHVEWTVLNSADFGVPQDAGCSLSAILIQDAPEKYFLSSAQMEKLLYKSSQGRKAPASMTQPESPAPKLPEQAAWVEKQDYTL